ncbi:MAG: S-layer homology domain-containing protein, partial [Anaerovoracaceae bacterium]
TRQDMAVIIDRYVEKLAPKKLENVNDKVDFADNSSISSYAADAVASMQQAGIISGKGANNFAPKDNATRAEACKMLAMVMQKTTEA